MSITDEPKKIKLYDKVFDLISRARILALSNNRGACDSVLKELDHVISQMDVQEFLWTFEQFQAERTMRLSNPDVDLSEVRSLAN